MSLRVFVDLIQTLALLDVEEYNSEKFDFIRNNDILTNEILNISTVTQNLEFNKIEENSDAISLLKKYIDKNECIVCDNNDIDSETLLLQKTENKEQVINNLDLETKRILEKIIEKLPNIDPFDIKNNLFEAIHSGNIDLVVELQSNLNDYKGILSKKINNLLGNSISEEFLNYYNNYLDMLSNELSFTDEDLIFIEQFIEKNINKNINLSRIDNKIKITLDDLDFLEVERDELKLSSGEQNFISLTFELLKAKNNDNEIIVIDDPISSFDSIFKNKLIYAIIKILSNKKVIILTHNIDVLRLIEVQAKNIFNLYLFNNFPEQENGFIKVNNEEKQILIYIPKLLEFLRSPEIRNFIIDERLFIYSLIPFMRGYLNFIGEITMKNELTKLMHGYNNDRIDLKNIFNNIFNQNVNTEYIISVNDILNIDINNLNEIINVESYPLFNRVLINNFIYLYLRLKTEKVLVDKYNINTNRYEQLSSIISESFEDNTDDNKRNKVAFFSKKTLLNEFNHFDGNMSIFQPAIDISESTLSKEKEEILNILLAL